MADRITREDLLIVLQHAANPRPRLKIEVLDANQKVIGILECGLQSGKMTINSEGDIRRTRFCCQSKDIC